MSDWAFSNPVTIRAFKHVCWTSYDNVDLFYDFVYAVINECVPPIWYDNDIISSLKEKYKSVETLTFTN